jgi:hypothetical protein
MPVATQEIHLHLEDVDENIHVYIHGRSGVVAAHRPAEVEAMLARFKDYDATAPAADLVEEMTALGYTPHAPAVRKAGSKPSPYIRFRAKGSNRGVSLYMNTSGINSESARDAAVLSAVPGAVVRGSRVYFRFELGVPVLLDVAKALLASAS